jgi:hypothetical protein
VITLILAVAASKLLVVDPRLSEKSKGLAQPYWDCVVYYAEKLETSGGSGEEVSIAAKQVCRERRLELRTSIDLDFVMGEPTNSNRSADQITAGLENELRSEIILNVLAKRAARADNASNK